MKKQAIISSVIGTVFLVALIVANFGGQIATATSQFLAETNVSATSTLSNINYIVTPGTGTTTVYLDAYGASDGKFTAFTDAALEIQFLASSSVSTLNWNYEYSQGKTGVNCVSSPGLCDWFADSLQDFSASTSPTVVIQPDRVFSWLFASSSPARATMSATFNRAHKIVSVKTPTRYVRAVFYAPIGSAPLGFWADFIGMKLAN